MLTIKLTPIEQVALLEGLEELYRQGAIRSRESGKLLDGIMDQLDRSPERAKLKAEMLKARDKK